MDSLRTFAVINTSNPLGIHDVSESEFKWQFAKWTGVKHKFTQDVLDDMTVAYVLRRVNTSAADVLRIGKFTYTRLGNTCVVYNVPIDDAMSVARGFGCLEFMFAEAVSSSHIKTTHFVSTTACQTYRNAGEVISDLAIDSEDAFQESMCSVRTFMSRASYRKSK